MSQFRIEKHRAEAEVTLSTGAVVHGWFFLAESAPIHVGPERIGDLLNAEIGFIPFETEHDTPDDTLLLNRAHVITVKLLERPAEARLEPGYEVAPERHVAMLLTNGARLTGAIRVYRPAGRDRVSDYTRSPEVFRYVENEDGSVLVNSAHIVELRETR